MTVYVIARSPHDHEGDEAIFYMTKSHSLKNYFVNMQIASLRSR